MPKFHKKPTVIEAMDLNDSNAAQVLSWTNRHGEVAILRGGPGGGSKGASIGIDTLEGRIWYAPGWVIIKGVKGEFYGCRRDVFEETYEAVDEQ